MAFGHTGKKAVSDRHRRDLRSRVRARGPKSTGQATCPISFKLVPVVLHRANTPAEVAASQQGVLWGPSVLGWEKQNLERNVAPAGTTAELSMLTI